MRVISKWTAEKGFIETDGVAVTRSACGGHLHAISPGQVILARVECAAFEKMVFVGDAIDRDFCHDDSTKCGGEQRIFRCHLETREDGIWLLPDAERSESILLFQRWTNRRLLATN